MYVVIIRESKKWTLFHNCSFSTLFSEIKLKRETISKPAVSWATSRNGISIWHGIFRFNESSSSRAFFPSRPRNCYNKLTRGNKSLAAHKINLSKEKLQQISWVRFLQRLRHLKSFRLLPLRRSTHSRQSFISIAQQTPRVHDDDDGILCVSSGILMTSILKAFGRNESEKRLHLPIT